VFKNNFNLMRLTNLPKETLDNILKTRTKTICVCVTVC